VAAGAEAGIFRMRSDKQELSPAVALIGMAGRFPGAPGVRQLWRQLCEGVESIRPLSEEELRQAGVPAELSTRPDYVKAAAVLDDVKLFAASFFGFTPLEARITDPQQRIFLECSWEALEDAGYVPSSYPGRIGVYAGSGLSTYLFSCVLPAGLVDTAGMFSLAIGNKPDFLPTQVSYRLNLRGPSVSVGTACSTSLVAVHIACLSLLNYECDLALAGGAQIAVPQTAGYLYQPGGVASPDGHCRAFDARGRGTVAGNGVGAVILKRLEEAVADGDHIYAAILGSAVNNDGAQKVGFTAPSVDGQADAVAGALAIAGIDSSSIGYVEAHGSGTELGDPIEIRALTKAFRLGSAGNGSCAVGSIKPNIGHLDAAAGVASLIKAALCLKHRRLVPSISYQVPNPHIDFATTPFFVNTMLREWESPAGVPRRAGVSSLGIGGTNAHVVLEEGGGSAGEPGRRSWKLLPLAARSAEALDTVCNNLGARLAEPDDRLLLDDVAYTLQVGRTAFGHRRAFVCEDAVTAAAVIKKRDSHQTIEAHTGERPAIVFLLPGIGDQYAAMACELYEKEPVFRHAIEESARVVGSMNGQSLIEVLYGTDQRAWRSSRHRGAVAGFGLDLRAMLGRGDRARDEDDRPLQRTAHSHVAVFAVEHALAKLWSSWGITPAAMLGHSLGEYVAACIAGVMTHADALMVVARRAELIEQLPRGAMLAVACPAKDLQASLSGSVTVAAINTPAQCVVSGSAAAIKALAAELSLRALAHRPVQAVHAFHSNMMLGLHEPLLRLLSTVALRAPKIPYISNITGTWVTDVQATDPQYWARHACQTVQFATGLNTLLSDGFRLFVELGPGQSLSSFLIQSAVPELRGQITALQSLPSLHEALADEFVVTRALGSLWCHGVQPDWAAYHLGEKRHRVPLPAYPFERQPYWAGDVQTDASTGQALLSGIPGVPTETLTELQTRVASMWVDVLGHREIGIHDSFLGLGGSSLLALQITTRLREAFQVDISLRTFFSNATIGKIAAVVEELLLQEIEAMSDEEARRQEA
jgi:phthiocerol/phenolphthiocerol synthesis type-I polyketide synthase E